MTVMRAEGATRLLSKDGSRHVTDERVNTLSATIGALCAMCGGWLLLRHAWPMKSLWHIVALTIYSASLFNLFLASALHHGMNGSPRLEHVLRQWDYFSIFLLIAGTTTPFCLIFLRTPLGWSALGGVWCIASFGIFWKALWPGVPRKWMTALYLLMGWLGAILFPPLAPILTWRGILWMLVGGLCFSLGCIIYLRERPNPIPGRFGFHEIWHCCVLAGAAAHYWVIYAYLLP